MFWRYKPRLQAFDGRRGRKSKFKIWCESEKSTKSGLVGRAMEQPQPPNKLMLLAIPTPSLSLFLPCLVKFTSFSCLLGLFLYQQTKYFMSLSRGMELVNFFLVRNAMACTETTLCSALIGILQSTTGHDDKKFCFSQSRCKIQTAKLRRNRRK